MSESIADIPELAGYPILLEHVVTWGEMDAFQHVNNTVYFKYFESARINYMAETGYMDDMKHSQTGPILADVYCKFKCPLTFPDKIIIGSKIDALKDSEFVMHHAVYSTQQKVIAATGYGKIVHYDYQAKSRAIFTDELLQQFYNLQPELKR